MLVNSFDFFVPLFYLPIQKYYHLHMVPVSYTAHKSKFQETKYHIFYHSLSPQPRPKVLYKMENLF